MGKYGDFIRSGELPQEGNIPYYEDTHRIGEKPEAAVRRIPTGSGGSVVVYEPFTPEDVELLIEYLKTRQSAIVRLVDQDPSIAQRILDMLAGAIFALGGSMATVEKNVYLLTPEGVTISVPAR